MKGFVLVLAACVALTNAKSTKGLTSLLDFGDMITCLGNLNYFQVAQYVDYGCFCGYGGSGSPVDPTDTILMEWRLKSLMGDFGMIGGSRLIRCCAIHDQCYNDAVKPEHGCGWLDTYFVDYKYTQYTDAAGNCAIRCLTEKEYPAQDARAKCKSFMCECDRKGSQCFANERDSFDTSFFNYSPSNCQ